MTRVPSPPDRVEPIRRLTVCPASDGWSLLVDDYPKPAWTVSTREKAVRAARHAARLLRAQLVIRKQPVAEVAR